MQKRRLTAIGAVGGVAAVLVAATVAWAAADRRNVQMLDACDPATFNAAIGEEVCVGGGGGVKFEHFIAQLVSTGDAPAWRFSPAQMTLAPGGTIEAVNRGGEFHTFTEVAAFGGGCVPDLNALLGLTPVPECGIPGIFGTTGAAPGDSVETGPLAAGTHRFLCLIHPWMRTTVQVG
jgi:plastocyanin